MWSDHGAPESASCYYLFRKGSNRDSDINRSPAPETRGFNWKNFYKGAPATLEAPYFDNLVHDPLPPINPRLAPALAFASRLGNAEYGLTLKRALLHRRPAAFFIDEAQHIGKISSGRKLQDQMDVVKALASCSPTRLVLIGTYELLNLRDLSGQLSRRRIDIHFKRYRRGDTDIKSFQSVLWNFQRHLPLMVEPALMKHWEYCYIHSIGCIGILKDWLTLTLNEALEEKASTITLEMLERTALSIDQCETIAYEAVEGERRLSKREGPSARLLQLLGMTDREITKSASTDEENKKKKSAKPRLPRPVGRRAPHRDKIGRE